MRDRPLIDRFRPTTLTRRQRLLVVYFVGLVTVVLVFTAVYYWGMRTLEDQPRSIFQAFNTVIETMTTTGYGADSPWETPAMNAFVATMQVSGVVIGFVTLRVLVIPLFERTPLNLDDRLSLKNDHVVVAEYERDTELMLDELDRIGVEYVLVESDEEVAKRLSDDGYQVLNGDPEHRADLDRATIGKASLLITDAGDRTASVVLTALETNESVRVVSFTESTRRRAALAEIGVDRSVAPHALIGRRLAEKVAMSPPTQPLADHGTDVVVREILVRRDSPLHGTRVGASPLRDHPDLTLVAGWFDGELRFSPDGDERLTPNTVLVVAGPERTVTDVTEEMAGVRTRRVASHSRIVVAGLDEGGREAVETLADVPVTTIDQSASSDPDVVGDATEPETLRAADIADASALVVTVDDDATALLTVAMARSLSDDLEILVRVTDAEKTSAAFRAGADYVLSVQRLCARLVATAAHGERVLDPVGQIRLVRAAGAPLAGQQLGAARTTGQDWTVIGVVRAGTLRTDPTTTIEDGDEVFLAGSDEGIQTFERTVAR